MPIINLLSCVVFGTRNANGETIFYKASDIMELASLTSTLPVSRSTSCLMKRKPRWAGDSLSATVKTVRSLLSRGREIYLCDRSAHYAHRIHRIRVASFGDFLRVKTDYGWSTVWYSECLVDESGRVLYSPVDDSVDDCLVSLVEDLSILPLR